MALDALPLTPNGKVDRAALPAPDWIESRTETYAAPRTATEEALARLWDDILELEPGRHPRRLLRAWRPLAACDAGHCGRGRCVWRHAASTRDIRGSDARGASRAYRAGPAPAQDAADHTLFVTAPRAGKPPLSFTQERFWFLDQLTPGTATYNVPMILRWTGSSMAALERSLSEIVRRHEALRTTFVVVDGAPVQRIAAPEPIKLPVVDLSPVPADTRIEEALA